MEMRGTLPMPDMTLRTPVNIRPAMSNVQLA